MTRVLTVDAGSSSLKLTLLDHGDSILRSAELAADENGMTHGGTPSTDRS